MAKRITKKVEWTEFVAVWERLRSVPAVAQEFGVSAATVQKKRQQLKAAGVPISPADRVRQAPPPVDEILKMLVKSQGKTMAELQAESKKLMREAAKAS